MKHSSAFSPSRTQFLRFATCTVASGLAACSGGGGSSIPAPAQLLGGSKSIQPATAGGPGTPASISIARTTGLGRVPRGLVGLSYEKTKLSFNFFSATNTNLIGCFNRLGQSVIRIGGLSVDTTTWVPTAAGRLYGQIAPADVDRLAAFIRTTGWQVIYGINLGNNTPANAASEAAYVANALGANLLGFEIGNECDHYWKNGTRSSSYTLSNFLTEWATYAAAIRQSVPNAPLTGPATSDNTTWTTTFASNQQSNVKILTQHHYRDNGKSSSVTMSELLQVDPYLLPLLQQLQTSASSNGISGGYRLGEANSFYNGGAANISNAHGAALWAIDYLMINAQAGSAGVHFHGGGLGTYDPYYTPIHDVTAGVDAIMPMFYGMLFVSQIAAGPTYSVNVSTTLNLTAYAVAGNDGATYLAIVNKDASNTANAAIDLGAPASSASILALTGSDLLAQSGTTLGGATVGIDGTWSPAPQSAVSIKKQSTLSLNVPPASAMLLKVT